MFQPYTYCLYHIPTKKKYYGVRLSPQDIPEKDLWIIYFSSSELVNNLIHEYGKDSFTYEIRKIFDDKDAAYQWEQKVLQRLDAARSANWLNQGYGKNWYRKGPMAESHKENIRNSKLGKKRGPQPKEWTDKIAAANRGKKRSAESRQNMSDAQKAYYAIHSAPMQDKHHKEETKEKIRISNLGKKRNKPAHNKGVPMKEEARQKMITTKRNNPRPAYNKGVPMKEDVKQRMIATKRRKYEERKANLLTNG